MYIGAQDCIVVVVVVVVVVGGGGGGSGGGGTIIRMEGLLIGGRQLRDGVTVKGRPVGKSIKGCGSGRTHYQGGPSLGDGVVKFFLFLVATKELGAHHTGTGVFVLPLFGRGGGGGAFLILLLRKRMQSYPMGQSHRSTGRRPSVYGRHR